MSRRGYSIGSRSDRGIVLPSVLWITMLAIVVATSYASTVHVNTRAADNIKTSMLLRHATTAGIYVALDRLIQDPSSAGNRFRVTIDNHVVEIEARPENAKTDLNSASEDELRRAFIESGIASDSAQSLAARVGDWRDQDNVARLHGMEDSDYFSLDRGYGAGDARIQDLVELLLMADLDRQLLYDLADRFTVYGGAFGIYTLTARVIPDSSGKSFVSRAIVGVSQQSRQPYRVLKWQHNHG